MDPERMKRLVQVEPPPGLERCVRQRLLEVVEAERVQNGPAGDEHRVKLGAPAVALPFAERCVYIAGLLGFGARALGVAAQMVWRAVLG
jgi:hypothetical protein